MTAPMPLRFVGCFHERHAREDDKGNVETIRQGESMLIPANTGLVTLIPTESTRLLETFVTQSI